MALSAAGSNPVVAECCGIDAVVSDNCVLPTKTVCAVCVDPTCRGSTIWRHSDTDCGRCFSDGARAQSIASSSERL